MARIFAIQEEGLSKASFSRVAKGTSESVTLGELARKARLPAPSVVRRLTESNSNLLEFVDCAEGGVSIGVGVSSLSCSSTSANEAGGLLSFFPYCDFISESICCGPRRGRC